MNMNMMKAKKSLQQKKSNVSLFPRQRGVLVLRELIRDFFWVFLVKHKIAFKLKDTYEIVVYQVRACLHEGKVPRLTELPWEG